MASPSLHVKVLRLGPRPHPSVLVFNADGSEFLRATPCVKGSGAQEIISTHKHFMRLCGHGPTECFGV